MTLRALADAVRALPRWDWNRHTQQGYPMIESDGGLYLDRGSVLRLIEQAAAEPMPGFAKQVEEQIYRAYANGHRDGLACGVQSVGFGISECEHVGSARLSK